MDCPIGRVCPYGTTTHFANTDELDHVLSTSAQNVPEVTRSPAHKMLMTVTLSIAGSSIACNSTNPVVAATLSVIVPFFSRGDPDDLAQPWKVPAFVRCSIKGPLTELSVRINLKHLVASMPPLSTLRIAISINSQNDGVVFAPGIAHSVHIEGLSSTFHDFATTIGDVDNIVTGIQSLQYTFQVVRVVRTNGDNNSQRMPPLRRAVISSLWQHYTKSRLPSRRLVLQIDLRTLPTIFVREHNNASETHLTFPKYAIDRNTTYEKLTKLLELSVQK